MLSFVEFIGDIYDKQIEAVKLAGRDFGYGREFLREISVFLF